MKKKIITLLLIQVFLSNMTFAGDWSWTRHLVNANNTFDSFTIVPKGDIGDEDSINSDEADIDMLIDSDFGENGNLNDAVLDPSTSQSNRPRLNSKLLKIAVAAGALVLVFPHDQAISDFVQDNTNSVTEVMAFGGELFGSTLPIAAAGAGYIIGLVMKNKKIKKTSILLAKSLLITGLIAQGLKRVFHRERPSSNGSGPYEFHGPGFNGDDLSFPSGHTITAFTFATFIAEYTKGKSKIIPVLAYAAATVGAWSRVHDGAHWASDVIVGALVGHLVTKFILKKHTSKSGISISPYMGPYGGMMVGVSYTGKQIGPVEDDTDSFLFDE
ncbi:MAG: phosphatase PAP2 family protein [Bacteriovoracaceae bacterium]|jgi:membrane-associated phospholipid phosphatase|nr:phosphatase PAP2 family protein [Bacteriovoracaceae bacterium]